MEARPLGDDPTAPTEAIRAIFERRVDDGYTPGNYFALFGADGIELEAGFGKSRLNGAVPGGTTAFRIASCTKSFTAAMLLILRDRGALDLDSPITRFVPDFASSAPHSDPVIPTIRMLMTMSAGLPTDDPWGDRQESMTKEELIALLRDGVPSVSVPGTSFEYSNLGYALLGQVIESASGRPYLTTMKCELLDPLGLTSTRYTRPDESSSDLALGYRKSFGQWLRLPFSGPGAFSPMGGLFSTPHDLARWAGWLASSFDTERTQPGPLSSASRREMQQIHRSVAVDPTARLDSPYELGYGFGLFVERDPVWGTTIHHSGGYPGFSTHMRWNTAAGIGIVGFENASYSGAKFPVTEALDHAVRHLGRHRVDPPPWPETLSLRVAAESLVREWQDDVAERIFAKNVALDIPYRERAGSIAQAIDSVGGIRLTPVDRSIESSGDSPAHLIWYLPGVHGRLRCEIRLAPTTPAVIQTFIVTPG